VRSRGHPARAGFTLIEMLAVLIILGILMAILIPRLGKAGEVAEEKITKLYLQNLNAAIGEYEQQFGDYPTSRFLDEWGPPPNPTNLGAETLVLCLWSPKWPGTTLAQDRVVNLDEDSTKKALASFPKPALFELRDEWGNPIAYFHRRDYGRRDAYVTDNPTTGEKIDSTVTAQKDDATGLYRNPNRFQLISAGLDGEFGTADDLGNWEKSK
jgi:prepilin-type N-terminal cleavage/methylation domain-containing protein